MKKKTDRGFDERKKRARALDNALKKLFPNTRMFLKYSNNFELLVAVILSAQCTDAMVNKVTADLFKKYPTLDHYLAAVPAEFERDIFRTGFYKNKTKNVLATAWKIKENFGGAVPNTMDELLSLSGVARKTANIVLGNAFGIVEGIAVDTHVARFAKKFELTTHKDPVKIEADLMALIPQKDWFTFTYRVIEFGRNYCPARKHDCTAHPLTSIFPKAAGNWPKAGQVVQ